jgi:phosphohistidine swiveling domain-containing protein
MVDRIFEAPDSGTWELETTHFSKPVSRYYSAIFPDSFKRGFKRGSDRYGLLLGYLQAELVHGFCYMRPVLALLPEGASPPKGYFEQPELLARFKNGQKAIENKQWHEDMKYWDEQVKPDSIQRIQLLQSITPDNLDTEALVQHLVDCYENLRQMVYRHHIFTIPCLIPVGLYLAKVSEWSGVTEAEALSLLRGSSPVSEGLAKFELAEVGKLLRQNNIEANQFSEKNSADTLKMLREWPGDIGEAIETYVQIVAYQLTSGYDITERYILEMPELLIGNIWSSLSKPENQNYEPFDRRQHSTVRNKIQPAHQPEFDSLLKEARFINRLRDERGVYNDARASGLSRRAILEAGKRLKASGRLLKASSLVHASHEEILSMLTGDSKLTNDTLQQREAWYDLNTTNDAPPILGPPQEPSPLVEALPEDARQAYSAMNAIGSNIGEQSEDENNEDKIVRGLAVNSGIFEGIARLIKTPADFQHIQQGDVLITKNTSASFNVIMPMLGAIVTDRGGQLSHAAIIAREFNIPAIVGSRNATQIIPDGAQVRVDGTAGTVEVLS